MAISFAISWNLLEIYACPVQIARDTIERNPTVVLFPASKIHLGQQL